MNFNRNGSVGEPLKVPAPHVLDNKRRSMSMGMRPVSDAICVVQGLLGGRGGSAGVGVGAGKAGAGGGAGGGGGGVGGEEGSGNTTGSTSVFGRLW